MCGSERWADAAAGAQVANASAPNALLAIAKQKRRRKDMTEAMTEKKPPPPPHPNRSSQQRQLLKPSEMKLSKEEPDMRHMQCPAGGADGSKGGKKGAVSCVFLKEALFSLPFTPDMSTSLYIMTPR